jgi:hypothetical protein
MNFTGRECFKKHMSSGLDPHRGQGLDQALQMLSALGAFVEVRTGRALVRRNFVTMPFEGDGEVDLAHWISPAAVGDPLATAEGTVYSILIAL